MPQAIIDRLQVVNVDECQERFPVRGALLVAQDGQLSVSLRPGEQACERVVCGGLPQFVLPGHLFVDEGDRGQHSLGLAASIDEGSAA